MGPIRAWARLKGHTPLNPIVHPSTRGGHHILAMLEREKTNA